MGQDRAMLRSLQSETVPPVFLAMPTDTEPPAPLPGLQCIEYKSESTEFNVNTASYLFTGM